MKKTIYLAVLFVLFLTTAYFAYNKLKGKVAVPNQLKEVSTTAPMEENNEQSNAKSNNDNEEDKIKALDFTVIDYDGNEIKLSDMLGKPIVINFWASWCSPCKGEMPDFNEVYDDVKDEIVFMMIDLVDGQNETVEKGKKYVENMDFTFPVYFDNTGEAGMVYGINSIPTTLFIDKDGYIITGAQGAIDKETLLTGIGFIRGEVK